MSLFLFFEGTVGSDQFMGQRLGISHHLSTEHLGGEGLELKFVVTIVRFNRGKGVAVIVA